MAKIIFTKAAAPDAPLPTAQLVMYADIADAKFKYKDSGNNVTSFGEMNSFSVSGDSGDTDQTISDGNTLIIAGGDGITTAAANTDTLTVTLDLTKDQAWTGSQRGTFPTEVTDGTIDMNAANNFLYDPAASPDELGFTSITNGQSGYIILDNGGDTITLAAHVKSPGGTGATDLSTTGVHLINYVTDGTTVYITYGKAMA